MSFNEKSAWVMSLALIVGGLGYFGMVAAASARTGALAPPTLPAVIVYSAVLVVVAIIGHALVAMLSPAEADDRPDERERRIIERSGHLSSYVLGAGVIVALALYLFSSDGNQLFYAVFASLMLAQVAEYVLQIYFYKTSV